MAFHRLHNPGAPVALRLGDLELQAFSISGLATYVLVPAFDACFDLGYCALEATQLRHVFLSHVHQDHSTGALRHHAIRQMVGARPPKIYVPVESAADLKAVFRAFERMEQRPAADLDAIIYGLAPGDTVRLSGRYTVRAFDVVHRIASRGYTVVESRRKLRAAYAHLSGAEIAAARARGEPVSDEVTAPVFTYIGDSTLETLRRHPEVGQSAVLFLEATHLGDTDPAASATWGHTHLAQLVALAREAPATLASPHIVIKHFSLRYSARDIARAFAALPPDLKPRVTFLV